MTTDFHVRPMRAEDVPACVGIVNAIIRQGGTTAHENLFTNDSFGTEYFKEPAIVLVVILDERILGFQACFEVERGVYSIGSFTDRDAPVRGAGHALFSETLRAASANGATSIIAKITSDNTGGLAYYSKMGFVDERIIEGDLTRKNGVTVDRIIKRFVL